MITWGLIFIGGAFGGLLRYLAAVRWPARDVRQLSVGLLIVNLAGAFLLGLVARLTADAGLVLLGTGLCGSLTTFSTFAVEVLRIWQAGHRVAAVRQGVIMALAGMGSGGLGLLIGGFSD